MADNNYNIGDAPRIDAIFADAAGAYIDPTSVVVTIKPDQSSTITTWTYPASTQIVRDSVGMYHFLIPLTMAGLWFYKVVGTGAIPLAKNGSLYCEPDNF